MIKKVFAVTGTATALVAGAALPAGASGESALTAGTSVAPAATSAPSTARANTRYSQISRFFCGYVNGHPAVGAQSRQAKYTSNTYSMTSTHVLQGYRNGRWINVRSRTYVKRNPVGGVWYYAPSAGSVLTWSLSGYTGSFRVKVNFRWNTPTRYYVASSATRACTVR